MVVNVSQWGHSISYASLKPASEKDFRDGGQGNDEYVLSVCKRRYVVVLSNNREINTRVSDVLVAPVYSLEDKDKTSEKILNYRNSLSFFYLDSDNNFPTIKESVVKLRNITLLQKSFLVESKKKEFSFSDVAMSAMLNRYISYLSQKTD